MKKSAFSLFLLLAIGTMFNACSTDVELYADYKDITVVYGLLDVDKDTNFIKINKAFLGPGSALDIAMIDDSCNYPNKLDAKIIEYKANYGSNNFQQTKVIQLDTVTIHNKDLGIFYAPDQLVYYTTEKIHQNTNQSKYKYELQIDRGDTILTATTNIVGGPSFYVSQGVLNFASNIPDGSIKWTPCPNAAVYEVLVKFNYVEVGPSNDSVHRCMTWSLGTHSDASLTSENNTYCITYKTKMFFSNLASYLGSDTLNTNVERLVFEPSLVISIAAGGDELYNFITVNGPSNSIVQTIPEYTNVNGGYGVFSSRNLYEKPVSFSSQSLIELKARENWRFRQAQ